MCIHSLSRHSAKKGRGLGDSNSAETKLAANAFVYEQMMREVARLRDRKDLRLPAYIEASARFAWFSHPGRFTDGAMENALLEIGRGLDGAVTKADVRTSMEHSRTLHVVSECYVTGGHTRVLAKWVQRDLSSLHSIVVTRPTCEVPTFLVDIAAERDAPITMLDPSDSILDRARQLKDLSAGMDRIILHHHPDDPVPVLAYATPGGPPVAMFNHAHFWFSLGVGVSDVIINTMPYFGKLTERYRYPRAIDLLRGPYGLDRLAWTEIEKSAAKRALGLPSNAPVVLTMGNEPYFAPDGHADFFATLEKLLTSIPEIEVIVVGVPETSPLIPDRIRRSSRVRFPGRVPDPRPYYEAADLFLESFPMPSLGALTEAVAYGQAFPVPAYAEHESPTRVNQERIGEIARRPATEAEYIAYIDDLIADRHGSSEKAADLRRRLIADDEGFGDQFPALYERLACHEHAPHDLPIVACSPSPDHLALASQTNLDSVNRAITHVLPIRSMLQSHARAAAAGYQSKGAAAAGVLRRLVRPALRRLPAKIRQRLDV